MRRRDPSRPATSPATIAPPLASWAIDLLRAFVRGDRPPDPPPEGVDARQLRRIGDRHHVAAILRHTIDPDRVPEPLRADWDRQARASLVAYCRALRATRRVAGILDAAGVPYAALRGMALAEWVYPDPRLRPMLDVDIFIPSGSRDVARKALESEGHHPGQVLRSQLVYRIEETFVELHLSLLTPKRYRDAADFPRWLAARRSQETSEGPISTLRAEHEILELILHSFIHHEIDRLLHLVDIALLVAAEPIRWDEVWAWADRHRVRRICEFTLALVESLFGLGLRRRDGAPLLPLGFGGRDPFTAFTRRFFAPDDPRCYLGRKRMLLTCAERWSTRGRQVLRFARGKDLARLWALRTRSR